MYVHCHRDFLVETLEAVRSIITCNASCGEEGTDARGVAGRAVACIRAELGHSVLVSAGHSRLFHLAPSSQVRRGERGSRENDEAGNTPDEEEAFTTEEAKSVYEKAMEEIENGENPYLILHGAKEIASIVKGGGLTSKSAYRRALQTLLREYEQWLHVTCLESEVDGTGLKQRDFTRMALMDALVWLLEAWMTKMREEFNLPSPDDVLDDVEGKALSVLADYILYQIVEGNDGEARRIASPLTHFVAEDLVPLPFYSILLGV